jgi:DUF971 family protein
MALGAIVAAACVFAALAGIARHGGTSVAAAGGTCQLGNKGQIKHVIYLQFDNTHFRRDNPQIASDLEQMPHLLNFLKDNGTLLTNDHTILISHTAGGIVSSLTGLYPDRNGQTVSNSYDYFQGSGVPTFTSSFKYWTDTVDGANETLPNMVGDGGQTAPAPWLTYTHAGCNVGGVSAANIELENNTAVTFTTLSAAAAAGATNVKVGSVTGFAVGQALTIEGDNATITAVGTAGATGTGLTFSPALASAHAAGVQAYVPNQSGDMTRVFGAGSQEWNEGRDSQFAASGTAARALAQTDFVGIAVHCALGATLCDAPTAKADDATTVPGSDDGYKALFGAKYVNPAITHGQPCVKATDGTNITDPFNHCGFPGFDGALAKNTLGMIAQMQENGVPVTFAYISDAHDNHTLVRASGPGEADYKQQLADYDAAFQAFFTRLANEGIDKSNTLFVVTVDEGDHFAGAQVTPDASGTATYSHTACPQASITAVTPCPANSIGEVNVKIGSVLPAGEPAYDLHFDDAPTFYVNGQPERTNLQVRQLERDLGNATAPDPYQNAVVPIADKMADVVEEQTLHMINSDPKRTPTFTMFGNPDFFFQSTNLSGGCAGSNVCINPGFAWNHGDSQEEIGNTWVGYVGPGVDQKGVDSTTWTDHTDLRPTVNALLGLQDGYLDDGRVVTQVLTDKALPKGLKDSRKAEKLGAAYKAINAPFGQFATDTLAASTAAIKSTDALKYDRIEASIATLTLERNALAGTIRQTLNDAASGAAKIDDDKVKDWVDSANDLLQRAHDLAATS